MAGIPAVATPVGLALEHPHLVRGVSLDPSGREIAKAVLADVADPAGTTLRIQDARLTAMSRYTADAFARRWESYLESLIK